MERYIKGALSILFFKLKLKNLNQNSVCIDCGANIGKYTKLMAKTGARVIAFEPNFTAMKFLRDYLQDFNNVELVSKGVSFKEETIEFFHHKNNQIDPLKYSTGFSSLSEKGNVDLGNSEKIDCIDFLDLISRLNYVDLIKMDIEGAEVGILEKIIERGLSRNFGYMFVEVHDHKIPSLKKRTDSIRQAIITHKIKNINLNWV